MKHDLAEDTQIGAGRLQDGKRAAVRARRRLDVRPLLADLVVEVPKIKPLQDGAERRIGVVDVLGGGAAEVAVLAPVPGPVVRHRLSPPPQLSSPREPRLGWEAKVAAGSQSERGDEHVGGLGVLRRRDKERSGERKEEEWRIADTRG